MHRSIISILVLLLVSFFITEETSAQLFGERSLGGGVLGRSTSRSARRTPGLDPSGQRFVRGSRRDGFVGSDRRDRRSFVGRSDATPTPRVQSAVSGIRTNRGNSGANSSGQPRAIGQMYPPRLELAPGLRANRQMSRAIETEASIALADRLSNLNAGPIGSTIEVSVVNRTATIQGVVASAKDRRRAEILASFEPGVSVVVNDLRLVGDSEVPSTVVPPDPVPTPVED